MNADRAVVKAASEAGVDRWKPQGDAELAYVLDEDGNLVLTWAIWAAYRDGNGDEQVDRIFADARTGRLVLKDARNKYARNRRTHSANNGTSLPGTLLITETGSSSDSAAQAAHTYIGVTYDYYNTIHGRDSYDDNGATLTSTVHYSSNYNNAFWNGSQMVYGDGDGTTFIELSKALDVDAHELTHAVTDRTGDMVYQKEPGALNEAWSDIMGASVEAWYDGSVSTSTWLLGEDIYTPNNGNNDALRYMANPTQDNYSPDYYPERLYQGSCTPNSNTNDNCGVHGNSGIANLAYVLVVQGGSHPRGKTSINVPAIGITKAQRIFYHALVNYLAPQSQFVDARNATAQSAADLYGQTEVDAVQKAWDAVGVPGGGTNPPGGGTLNNGVPVSGISGASGSQQFWTMAVPSGASNLSFQISGGSGDADLYVRFGSAPTTSSYNCRPYLNGNNETCSFASPSTGTYHVMLRAYSTFSGVTLVGSYSTTTPNQAPTANFTFTTNNLQASFSDSSSDSDGSIASRSWNFGDGSTSTSTNPSHTYAAAGTYSVTLTVTDDDGATDNVSKNVTVTAPPTGGCSGGTSYTGTLSNGGSAYQPNGTYYYSGSGTHNGVLDGPAGTDFDLYLYKWQGGSWTTVKSGLTSTSHEEVTYSGSTGYYTWKVVSYSGSGSYTLCLNTP
jgi:vibriolysin